MPLYYVQSFEDGAKGDTVCYAEESAHNHTRSNQFTKDVLDYLAGAEVRWQRNKIRTGKFQSKQPVPRAGKEFVWNKQKRKWIRVKAARASRLK